MCTRNCLFVAATTGGLRRVEPANAGSQSSADKNQIEQNMKTTIPLRGWTRGLGAAALAFTFAMLGAPEARAQAKKPNIVIIWGDDVGQSDISAYSMGLMGFKT